MIFFILGTHVQYYNKIETFGEKGINNTILTYLRFYYKLLHTTLIF